MRRCLFLVVVFLCAVFVVYCLLFVVWCALCVGRRVSFIVRGLLFVGCSCCSWFVCVVSCLLLFVLLFVVRCVLFVFVC